MPILLSGTGQNYPKQGYSWYLIEETLHTPENAPEIRLILQALPLPITCDITQQSFFNV